VQLPDGASTTTYAYSGNRTTVTDPAGKWKQFTSDVSGNLTATVEPDPANYPSGTLTTSYTYDWMNHVIGVSMPRGSTTQTRTFVYDSAGRLTSANNPENGTVTYPYYSNNALLDNHDAKGQDTVYSYGTSNRVTMIQYFPQGKNNAEDMCARVTYSYGTSTSAPQYTYGRLASVQYCRVRWWNTSGNAASRTQYTENYSSGGRSHRQTASIQPARVRFIHRGRRSGNRHPASVPCHTCAPP
jgi:YD repeat-containing protein